VGLIWSSYGALFSFSFLYKLEMYEFFLESFRETEAMFV